MKSLLPLVLLVAWISAAWAADPRPVTVTVGEEFKLKLESDSSTGCQWLLAKPLDETLLKQAGKAYERPRDSRSTVGFEVLTYKALAEGKTTIQLKFDRLWEKARAPLENHERQRGDHKKRIKVRGGIGVQGSRRLAVAGVVAPQSAPVLPAVTEAAVRNQAQAGLTGLVGRTQV